MYVYAFSCTTGLKTGGKYVEILFTPIIAHHLLKMGQKSQVASALPQQEFLVEKER